MIRIKAEVDTEGILTTCAISGHASGVVCAAVSALAGTAMRVLADRAGIAVNADAPSRGRLTLSAEYTPEGKAFLAGAGAFLLEGLQFVSEEYPNHCTILIKRRN